MKSLLICFLFLFLFSLGSQAQPDFQTAQNRWMQALNEDAGVKELLFPKGYLFYKDGNVTESDNESSADGLGLDRQISSYKQLQLFKHDEARYITIGNIIYGEDAYIIMTGWMKADSGWTKMIDIMVAQQSDTSLSEIIEQQLSEERLEWVRLANQHDPAAHIQASYTQDAVYYSNSSRSDGHSGIAERYSYMKNPNYQVDLESSRMLQTKANEVLEVGRYFTGKVRRGSGGLYVILWEKKEEVDGWKIKLDFNF